MAKTLKVRIPAMIGPDGRWCAYGYPEAEKEPDWSMMAEVADKGDDCSFEYHRVWITVELPVPEDSEVDALTVEAR